MPTHDSQFPYRVEYDFDLSQYNSMGIACTAREVIFIEDPNQLKEISNPSNLFIIGGGSNMLLPDTLNKTVLINEIKGREVIRESDSHIWVEVGGGVNWHDLVSWAVDSGYGGIENLALIPGTVGAAPIQNIGAYGVELAHVFEELTAYHWDSGEFCTLNKEDCHFGYRDSIFKNGLKGQVMITSVVLRLIRLEHHQFNTTYRALTDFLGDSELSLKGIFQAVIDIRSSKLPDPLEIGNCGSFFKNTVVDRQTFDSLQSEYADIPGYPQADDMVKIPTAWLIDQCGWKGHKRGDIGVYSKQALVLVNYGNGTSKELRELAADIAESVKKKFGIRIEPEVNIIL